jgi:hypothetical protein
MRVGASRPRQTSQGDDKEKNTSDERATGDDNEGQSGNNNRETGEGAENEQESGWIFQNISDLSSFYLLELCQIV